MLNGFVIKVCEYQILYKIIQFGWMQIKVTLSNLNYVIVVSMIVFQTNQFLSI